MHQDLTTKMTTDDLRILLDQSLLLSTLGGVTADDMERLAKACANLYSEPAEEANQTTQMINFLLDTLTDEQLQLVEDYIKNLKLED